MVQEFLEKCGCARVSPYAFFIVMDVERNHEFIRNDESGFELQHEQKIP